MVQCPKCGSFGVVLKVYHDGEKVIENFIYCEACGEGRERVVKEPLNQRPG